jgi:hypothetical protein
VREAAPGMARPGAGQGALGSGVGGGSRGCGGAIGALPRMNYLLPEDNWACRTFDHRYGNAYFAAPGVRRTCWLCGHTVPPMPAVPQSREDYEEWVGRGAPKDQDGNWVTNHD